MTSAGSSTPLHHANADCGISQNHFFFGEEYKQYLTFSVAITKNTISSAYNENVWNDEKELMHERIKSLHDSRKGYRTNAKLWNAEGSRTAKNKEWKTLMSMQFLNDTQNDKHD
ncbi:hypothetical protein OA416_01450 [Paracoccaceae bacterium]|nr:hypothetical protein [Paracoccaceae bacterium]